MQKMILLTGATGFVGGNLLKEMLNQGFKVRCLVRNPSKAEAIKQAGVELVQGDVTDRDSIAKALEDGKVEAAVHLVGILAETKECKEVYPHKRAWHKRECKERISQDKMGGRGDNKTFRP